MRSTYKKWYEANRERILEYRRQYYQANRDKILAQNKAGRNGLYARRARLKSYGLTLEAYQQQIVAQAGKCAICGVQPDKFDVDHNHTTGVFRALLCHNCNTLIGMARESVGVLERAIGYLNEHSKQSLPARKNNSRRWLC